MIGNETQNTPGLPLVAADDFSHFRPEQTDHHNPSRTDDVDMRRRVVVGIDHDPQFLEAQDRQHLLLLADPPGIMPGLIAGLREGFATL